MTHRIFKGLFKLFAGFICVLNLNAQKMVIKGLIHDSYRDKPISGVVVEILYEDISTRSDQSGAFTLSSDSPGLKLIRFGKENYRSITMEIQQQETEVDLGLIPMELKQNEIEAHSIIGHEELNLEDDLLPNTGVLSANRDILANRAAFDFGQAFFRIRGYDSRNRRVLINGIPMNRMSNGRAQWSNWGGLNDVFRNQEYTPGLANSSRSFGNLLGVTNMTARPGLLRPGIRITSSFSNRTYKTRLMVTYTRSPEASGWGYTLSASRRWGSSGFIHGTPYDAYAVFGSLEHQFEPGHGIYLTAFISSNQRGRNSAITKEIYELLGGRFNPNWGLHDSKVHHSKLRKIEEPVIILNYYYNSEKLDIEAGILYQWGTRANSRLGYYNAPNPNPDYYQYLPSYFINSPIGANFIGAEMARTSFEDNHQINWLSLYQSNKAASSAGKASYILYEDKALENSIRAHSHANWRVGPFTHIDFGIDYVRSTSENFSEISDLLGAEYHLDIDPFSDTLNEIGGNPQKKQNEIFGYHYDIHYRSLDVFAQWRFVFDRFNGFFSAKYYNNSYQRVGLFMNERFPENSLGKSETIAFSNFGIKAGISYEFTKRYRLEANGFYSFRPPVLENVFINPRENNNHIKYLSDEVISSLDIGCKFDLPVVSGRLTAYYTRFQNTNDINYFFVNSGVGSDFVQEVITGLDRLHTGLELVLVYRPSSSISLSAVASVSKFLYASDPNVEINFDTAGAEEDLINVEGQADLGLASLKGKNYAAGPAQAFSLGIEYRDPDYWRLGLSINRMAERYIRLSPITRTESFKINPDTGLQYPGASPENIQKLLRQNSLDEVYLLNFNFGKSWLWKQKYISVFASVSNLLDAEFISGGYEQSRNGNYGQAVRDNLSGRPSFGPKYWYGYGRTYFLNLAVSF